MEDLNSALDPGMSSPVLPLDGHGLKINYPRDVYLF